MKGIVGFLIRMVVLNIVLVPIMVLGPVFYVIPFFCIAANPHDSFSGLAQLYFWLGPLSCAFWMLVSCHWQTVHRARLKGRLDTWRRDAGGYAATLPKAFAFMLLGLFGSFLTETVFILLYGMPRRNPWALRLWFALLPFATFAPVILLWLRRWRHSRREMEMG